MNNSHKRDNLESWRLYIVLGTIATVFLFYMFRLFSLQVINGQIFLDQANENRIKNVSEMTQRGIITDRNGFVLARNAPSYNVIITPAYLPTDEGTLQKIYRELSKLIDIPVNRGEITDESVKTFKYCDNNFGISQIVYIGDTNAPYTPVQVKCNIDEKTALIIQGKQSDWPGVGVEIIPVREYPTGSLTSEVIGFLGPIPAALEASMKEKGFVPGRDKYGYAGVENSLNEILMGQNGKRTIEVDVAGKEIRNITNPIAPVPGNNVKLTIDVRLQNAAKTALISEINFWNTYLNRIQSANGVVIALNPKTGEILALVSYPTYENNRMARFIPAYYYNQISNDPNRPLFNHAVSAEHSPGSVFKMVTAIGALNEGVVTPDKELEDLGKITIMQKFTENEVGIPRDYVCHLATGHGMVNFLKGVAQSCNVYFYKLGGGYQNEVPKGLGIWRIGEYARALGYGAISGVELPGESTGLIPDPTWKRINLGENWATGDTYIATVGQGYVLATPIQVVMSAATIGNNGKLMQPTLVREITDKDGDVVKPFEPKMKWDLTVDPKIQVFDEDFLPTGEMKTIEPWVLQMAKEGMREVVRNGTATKEFVGLESLKVAAKTGTAEYCDNIAQAKNLCQPGNWPSHAWFMAFAPYDDPEIAVVSFVYNGGEGASVSGPVVRKVMDAYFELKAIDAAANLQQ
ncbi:MAG: penicillin-binding protein 2 [Chloroflexi bacterium]|nr:penicillin-binding protein 2 [Chloroflexota bacterium]BCY18413.1 penicillin-binding protein 2 [Leptolinea sp. HRD-7]